MLFRSDQQHTLLCFLFVLGQGPMTLTELAKATGINPVIFPSSDWDHPQPDSLAERLKTTGQLVDVHRPVEFVAAEPLLLSRAFKVMSVSQR